MPHAQAYQTEALATWSLLLTQSGTKGVDSMFYFEEGCSGMFDV